MFARFRAANHELAAEEFLIVQLLHRAFRFLDRLHLDEGETFRALVVAIAHDFGVLHMADAIEELEEIALGRVEGQIADVKTRGSDFDCLRLALRPWLALLWRSLLMLLLAVTRRRGWFLLAAVSSKKFGDALPKCFLLRSRRALLILKTPATASSSRPTAPMALASPV